MIINNVEILDHIWYGNFGFVKGQDIHTKKINIYAGEGLGEDIAKDLYLIINFGSKYEKEDFKELVEWLRGYEQEGGSEND